MNINIKKIHLNHIFALGVFLSVFLGYLSIIAPSVSFWDCGEYIAAGATLGILHPPGNPLYVIIARIASSLFFFIPDPGLRITLLSPLFGALTAVFVFLTIVTILTHLVTPPLTTQKRFIVIAGGLVGSFFAAFANTVVFSAVEAEVNVPLLLPIAACTWLAIKWGYSRSPNRDRLLILLAFICFLGIGIHMYAMIVMPALFLYVIIKDPGKRKDWRFWATTTGMSLIMYQLSFYLFIGIGLIIVNFIFMLCATKAKEQWKFCLYLSLASYLGFSIHFYIPLRSAMNPSLDMNHPASLQTFMDYLDRKQYGKDSMIKRMTWRRGQWKNQFGIEGHIGFAGFFLTQFFRLDSQDTAVSWFQGNFLRGFAKLLIYLLPLLFMFYGWWALLKKSRTLAILLISLTLSTTVILVVYMNFSDGTKSEYHDYIRWKQSGKGYPLPKARREVRIRDYFYIGGFMHYGMWMGIASGLLLLSLYQNKKNAIRKATPWVAVLILLTPSLPLTNNLSHNNRRGDFIPYNYAWNLLMSCDKNAILFTYGDNDTYPLWALQEAYNIRKDIRVVNLSLLGTSWYIKQCKYQKPQVPITMSDKQITALTPEINPFLNDTHYTMQGAGIPVILPGRQRQTALLVQNKMVVHIVDANKWQKPIYFAASVPPSQFMGLDPYLNQEGMVYRVTKTARGDKPRLDTQRCEYLLDQVYKFHNMPAHRLRTDKATASATSVYSILFLQCASERLRQASIKKGIIEEYIKGKSMTTKSGRKYVTLQLEQMQQDIIKGIAYLDKRGSIFGEMRYSNKLRKYFTQLQEYAKAVLGASNNLTNEARR